MPAIVAVLVLCFACAPLSLAAEAGRPATAEDFEQRMSAAIGLHDAGQFDGAISAYRGLLKDYPSHPRVLYEIAFSSMHGGKLDDAIEYSEQALRLHSDYQAQVYVVLGTAYDMKKDLKKGEKAFRRGVKEVPGECLLHFNLAVNLGQQNRLDEAIPEFQEGLRIDPAHPGSWRSLAIAYANTGQRSRALACHARFLTLEPDSKRSAESARQLWTLLFEGVTTKQDADGKSKVDINITMPPPGKKGEDDPASAQAFALSLVAATRYIDEWEHKTDAQFFAHALDNVLSILSEMDGRAEPIDAFWGRHVHPYFQDARAAGHMEAMAYDIRRSLGDPETAKWLDGHAEAIAAYRAWSKGWKPPAASPAGSP
jgi:tetratricopeptide (TPR) repeat protein